MARVQLREGIFRGVDMLSENWVKIDERTWRFEDRGVRFFLLMGDNQALLVDSGMTIPNASLRRS